MTISLSSSLQKLSPILFPHPFASLFSHHISFLALYLSFPTCLPTSLSLPFPHIRFLTSLRTFFPSTFTSFHQHLTMTYFFNSLRASTFPCLFLLSSSSYIFPHQPSLLLLSSFFISRPLVSIDLFFVHGSSIDSFADVPQTMNN